MKHLSKKVVVKDLAEQVDEGEDGVNDSCSELSFKQIFGWHDNSGTTGQSPTLSKTATAHGTAGQLPTLSKTPTAHSTAGQLPTLSKTPTVHIDVPGRCDNLQSDPASNQDEVSGNSARGATLYDRVKQRWMRKGLVGAVGSRCSAHGDDDGRPDDIQLEVVAVKANVVSVTGKDCCNICEQTNGVPAKQSSLNSEVSGNQKCMDASTNRKSLNRDVLANQKSLSTGASTNQKSLSTGASANQKSLSTGASANQKSSYASNETDHTYNRNMLINGEEGNWYKEGCCPRNHVLSWLPRCQRQAGRFGIVQRLMYLSPVVMVNCSSYRVTGKETNSIPSMEDRECTNGNINGDSSVKYRKRLRVGKKVDYMKTKIGHFGMCNEGTEYDEDNPNEGIVEKQVDRARISSQKGDKNGYSAAKGDKNADSAVKGDKNTDSAVKLSTPGVCSTGKQAIGLNLPTEVECSSLYKPQQQLEVDNQSPVNDSIWDGPASKTVTRYGNTSKHKVDEIPQYGIVGSYRKPSDNKLLEADDTVSVSKKRIYDHANMNTGDNGLATIRKRLRKREKIDYMGTKIGQFGMTKKSREDIKETMGEQVPTGKATGAITLGEVSCLGEDSEQRNEARQLGVEGNKCDHYRVGRKTDHETFEVENQTVSGNDVLTTHDDGLDVLSFVARPLPFGSEEHLKLYDQKQTKDDVVEKQTKDDAVEKQTMEDVFEKFARKENIARNRSNVYEENVVMAKDDVNRDCMRETGERLVLVTEETCMHPCDGEFVCNNSNVHEAPVKKWLRVREKVDYTRTNIDNFGMPSKKVDYTRTNIDNFGMPSKKVDYTRTNIDNFGMPSKKVDYTRTNIDNFGMPSKKVDYTRTNIDNFGMPSKKVDYTRTNIDNFGMPSKKVDVTRTNIDNFGMPSTSTQFQQPQSSGLFLNDHIKKAKRIQGHESLVDIKKQKFDDDNLEINKPASQLEYMMQDVNNNTVETKDNFVKYKRSETLVRDEIIFSARRLVTEGLTENLGEREPRNVETGAVESFSEDNSGESLLAYKQVVPLLERSDAQHSLVDDGSARHQSAGLEDECPGMSTDTDKEQLKIKDHLQWGSVVWGKFTKRWWPAVVIDGEMLGRSTKVGHTWLYWLSDQQVSQVKDVYVEPLYTSFSLRTVRKSLSKSMRTGLQKAFEICAERAGIEVDEYSAGAMDWGLEGGYLQMATEHGRLFSPNPDSPIPTSVLYDLHRLARMMMVTPPPGREAGLDDDAGLSVHSDCDEDGPDVADLNKGEQLQAGEGTTCIACDGKFSTTFKHPLFEGMLCIKCKEILQCRFYAMDDDGYCLYCALCGQGGEVLLCDDIQCARVYCADCIKDNAGADVLEMVRSSDRWLCFLCTDYDGRSHGSLKPRPDWRQEVVKFFQAGHVTLCEDLHYLTDCKRKIRVLSLFDGIATGKVALDELGLDVEVYYTSEVSEDAEIVTSYHHRVVQLGDAWSLDRNKLAAICPIDLVIGGPPCNDLSIVNPLRKGFCGTGILLIKFITILKDVEALCKGTNHVFWLLENSGAMLTEYKQIVSKLLAMKPAVWDAKHFSGQRRARNFWGNIPGMFSTPDLCRHLEQDKTELDAAILTNCNRKAQVSHTRTITTQPNSLTIHNGRDEQLVLMNGQEDCIWTQELERLFGLPAHYTDVGPLTHQRRRKLLGKAWSVPVIKHLLSSLKQFYRLQQ